MHGLPHLKHIPRLTPLTTWRLPRGDLKILGRKTYWSLHSEILAFGTLDEFLADFLQRGDFAGGESDADLVDLRLVELRRLLGVLEGHFGGVCFACAGLACWARDVWIPITTATCVSKAPLAASR